MCFAEFIGYQCGHTSPAVNRPCPLVTIQHNNPCCPRPAVRPLLAPTMCFPCARIIHGRRLDIAEFEHHWMHLRGACACEVVFPDSQGPRLVGRPGGSIGDEYNEREAMMGRGGYDSSATTPRPIPSNKQAVTNNHEANNHNGNSNGSVNGNQQQRSSRSEIPMYRQAQAGEHVEVAVRMSSLYAAEWTRDHAKLHQSGQCQCPVSFECYQPLDTGDDAEGMEGKRSVKSPAASCSSTAGPSFTQRMNDAVRKQNTYVPAQYRNAHNSSHQQDDYYPNVASYPNAAGYFKTPSEANNDSPSSSNHHHNRYSTGVPSSSSSSYNHHQEGNNSPVKPHHHTRTHPHDNPPLLPNHKRIPPRHPARWAMEAPHNGSLLDEILGPIGARSYQEGGRPADLQTVHYNYHNNRNLPLAGRPLVDPVPEEDEDGEEGLPPMVEFPQPADTIAGFPIGAGPEGDSHAGDFAGCVLRQQQQQQYRANDSLYPPAVAGLRMRRSTDF